MLQPLCSVYYYVTTTKKNHIAKIHPKIINFRDKTDKLLSLPLITVSLH